MKREKIRFPGRARTAPLVGGVLVALFLFLCFDVAPAFAFEREWHVGAGVGAANLSATGVGWGPEAGIHGAYGLSDTFDVRLEARFSQHPVRFARELQAFDEQRRFLRTEVIVAYKLDILRWVPWLGVGAGYFHAFEDPLSEQNLRRSDALLSGLFGLDYSVTRSLGVGLALRTALLLAGSADYGGQLRVEYRWGF